MSFQPAPMFLYAGSKQTAAADMHWSATCSRALLAAGQVASNNRSAEHEQLASALLVNQHHQQQANDKLSRLLAAAARSHQLEQQQHEEDDDDEDDELAEVLDEENSIKRQQDMYEEEEEDGDQVEDEDGGRKQVVAGMQLEAEQETALNLSLNNNQRNQESPSEHQIKLRTSQAGRASSRALDTQADYHHLTHHHQHPNEQQRNVDNSSFMNGTHHDSIMNANETNAQTNLHLNNQHHQIKQHQHNNPQQQQQQQQQQLMNQQHITHLNTFNLAGSSGSTPTSSSSASSSSSSYSASSYSLSSASSTSSNGWSAADSLASCSPERAACISSPPNSAASLLGPCNQQQQQQQAPAHLNSLRPLFHHHHHHHHHHHELGPVHKTDTDDLNRIRSFIEQFKARRGALGLTQKQAAQCFRAYTNDRYQFSDNFVGHFEGFQFRPQTAMTIADSLAEWLEFAENETRTGRQLSFMPGKVKETRKRKYEVIRIRDSAKRVLVEAFEKNKSPSTSELEQLSRRTNIPSRNIEIFFKNRRTSRQYHQ